jgi:hypothetical protein
MWEGGYLSYQENDKNRKELTAYEELFDFLRRVNELVCLAGTRECLKVG